MGHNSVVSGQPKSTGIPQVDRLSMGPPDLGFHIFTDVRSTMVTIMFVCAFWKYLPEHLRYFLERCCQELLNFFNPHISITFNEFLGK